jgi:hypothetical protein
MYPLFLVERLEEAECALGVNLAWRFVDHIHINRPAHVHHHETAGILSDEPLTLCQPFVSGQLSDYALNR